MQFKTFWLRFTQSETNANAGELVKGKGMPIQEIIDQELNDWIKEHPGGRIVQMVQSCTSHNNQYIVLTFPIYAFGLCSCGLLVHPL
jgi:hypothetical protein